MTNPLSATDPSINASVHASAGTGKTWLLTTRLLRLLLSGVEPGRLLALTFTRKAAAEMQERLTTRTREFLTSSAPQLELLLTECGIAPSPSTCKAARQLHEKLLLSKQPPRILTFHAFCQQLLLRFPFEAAIPPAFDLLESSSSVLNEAWELLYQQPYGSTLSYHKELETLFTQMNTLDTARDFLDQFLYARLDWWAYTWQQTDPVAYATTCLKEQLLLTKYANPNSETLLAALFTPACLHDMQQLRSYLDGHSAVREKTRYQAISAALATNTGFTQRFEHLRLALFFKNGNPYPFSNALKKSLGANIEDFTSVCERLGQQVDNAADLMARCEVFSLNQLWYRLGYEFLTLFQKIKQERRYLDFADLEWKTFVLLNQSDNALWVQYKLDERIDHLLVDEFQDTNPTQWHLLLPLLQELAAGDPERQRSLFLVGDEKQSIYQFRRANPLLFTQAASWMQEHLSSERFELSQSRRSSPAIIELVNQIFAPEQTETLLPGFLRHETTLKTLWGKVTLAPLFADDKTAVAPPLTVFRNPLVAAKADEQEQRQTREAAWIANSIQQLIQQQTPILDNGRARAIRYSDILVLFRKRTNALFYEQALSATNIPFVSSGRGTLLDCLEIQDLCALLNVLSNPYDNLHLAHVLRSPLFDIHEQDLLTLANRGSGAWIERLTDPNTRTDTTKDTQADTQTQLPPKLVNAAKIINDWRERAHRLPLHDLLDYIFFDANILARYERAFPPTLFARVRSNFARFIELALDLDSGRYPSIGRFLEHLAELHVSTQDAPDTPPANSEDRVQLLTIHGAKGLEAAAVYLVDTAFGRKPASGQQLFAEWDLQENRPHCFFLSPAKLKGCDFLRPWQERSDCIQQRENMNLLYVALTRAKQYLFISGNQGANINPEAWYPLIQTGLSSLGTPDEQGQITYIFGEQPAPTLVANVQQNKTNLPPEIRTLAIHQPIRTPSTRESDLSAEKKLREPNRDAPGDKVRGILTHKLLEWRTANSSLNRDHAWLQCRRFPAMSIDRELFEKCWSRVDSLLRDETLSLIFNPEHFQHAYNEVPVSLNNNGAMIQGVIDRLVVYANKILVLDYKTHPAHDDDSRKTIVEEYKPQLQRYQTVVKNIWKNIPVDTAILFTETGTLVMV